MDFNGNSVSGVAGIYADQKKVVGFESGTTSIGGDPRLRLGRQQGVESFDHNTVSLMEPIRLGRFIGVWTKLPTFWDPLVADYFRVFFEDNIREVSGLSDNTVELMNRTTGAVGREESYLGYFKESNSKFTLKVPEVKGSPVRKILEYHFGGISDPKTGHCHYYGKENLRHSKVNYGGDFLYILLGPTMRPDDIEFAGMWLNAFPNTIPLSHLNSGTIGEAGDANLEIDVEFSGSFVHDETVNAIAQKVVAAMGFYKDNNQKTVLPSYLYNDYLIDATNESVAQKIGRADLKGKLEAVKAESASATAILENSETILNPTNDVVLNEGEASTSTFNTSVE